MERVKEILEDIRSNIKVIKWSSRIADFLFTWIPLFVILILCTVTLFPWSDLLGGNIGFISFVSGRDSVLAIVIISYVVVLAKNNFDLNQKIIKKLDNMHTTDADSLFIIREEMEPFSQLFSEADCVKFSGGHLNSVVIGAYDDLLSFLKKGNKAVFLLPNPTRYGVMRIYAEKLMVETTVQEFTSLLLVSLKKLIELKNAGYDVDIRLYNTIPAFGLQIIEAKKASRMYVELYTFRTELKERISFPVKLSDSGEMYIRFLKQFDALWNDSHELAKQRLRRNFRGCLKGIILFEKRCRIVIYQ